MSDSVCSVSVIMPTRNEAKFIARSLGAILAQDYPADRVEVIVVDGMSDDGTRGIIEEYAGKDRRIVLIDNPGKIVSCGMNLGIKKAKGDVVFRIDGHSVIPPDYITQCVKWLNKEKVDGVGGAVDSEAMSYVGEAIAAGMSSAFGIGTSGFRTARQDGVPIEVDTLPFWAFRRSVFERIGLFNEQMVRHQDYELNYRLRSAGGKLLLLPWLRVKYYVRSTLRNFWRQYWQYGIWKGRFLRTYPASVRVRHLVPPAFVFTIATAILLSLFSLKLGLVCLILLGASYCCYLCFATVMLVVRGHLKQAPLIPVVLSSLHLVWGAGVWAGLIRGTVAGPGRPDQNRRAGHRGVVDSEAQPMSDVCSVSVVMPARNEAQFIARGLGAILAQDYPQDKVEVIIVDGMSDDGTREMVKEVAGKNPRMVMLDNPKRIMPSGMNLGIKKAKGDVIFCIGGHAVIPPDYITQCVKWLNKENVDGVGGAVDSEAMSYVGEAIAACMSSAFGIGASGFRTAKQDSVPIEVDTLPFWAFRRSVFERIGLFNEQMVRHQDYELNYRLRSTGGKLLLLPWLRVKYYVRSTLRNFWRQYWQYGIWKGRFLRTYPASVRVRHLIPPLFVLSMIMAIASMLVAPATGFECLSLLVVIYCSYLVVATVWLAMKGHLAHAPLIPLVLLSLHLIWGSGVWVGLLLSGKISEKADRLPNLPQ
jgi:succinoglycan biosynthesis protein ExoA